MGKGKLTSVFKNRAVGANLCGRPLIEKWYEFAPKPPE